MGRRVRFSDERGASLLLALGFLALCGLLIPAIVNLGGTNLVDTSRLQEQRAVVYTADGAVDATLQYLRVNLGCGREFGQCGLPSNTFTVTINNNTTATVSVSPSTGANPLDLDRRVDLVAKINGKDRLDASAVIRDGLIGTVDPSNGSTISAGYQPVDVKSWVYNR
jgi:hypothetical protein